MSIEQSLRELSQVSSHQFPDSSAKWLLRQREHLEALLEMFLGSLVAAFDFDQIEQVHRSFIPDELRTQESDMVFSLPFRTPQPRQEVIVYLLIEHQSTVDRSMQLRLLSYMVQIWMEERRQWIAAKQPEAEWRVTPIIPIVFYTGSREWKAPLSVAALMDIPEALTRFVPTFDTFLLDVKATAPERLTETGHPLGWVLTVLQQERPKDPGAMRQALLDALDGLRDLRTDDAEAHERAILYIFLLILHRRDADEHQDLLRLLIQETTQNTELVDMAESIIEISEKRGHQRGKQEGKQEGRQEGRQEGLEQGEIHGKQEALLKLLHHRFPPVPDAVITRVRALRSPVELDALFEKGLTAKSLEDLQ